MEEKERYVYHEVSNEVEQYVCYYDIEECQELFDDEEVLNRLNQQDKHIKELQANNEILKTSKSHFKKVAENVVDLLGKLNKFIGEPQTRELNYCKVIEDTKNYIEELKQSQNQQVINILEELHLLFRNGICDFTTRQYVCAIIENQIKELKGEK